MLELRLNKLITEDVLKGYEQQVSKINEVIKNKTGAGNDFLGWVDWPVNYDKEELARIIRDAKYVRDNFDVLVVCGIGGSYLGARSALEALNGLKSPDKLEIIFCGGAAAKLRFVEQRQRQPDGARLLHEQPVGLANERVPLMKHQRHFLAVDGKTRGNGGKTAHAQKNIWFEFRQNSLCDANAAPQLKGKPHQRHDAIGQTNRRQRP